MADYVIVGGGSAGCALAARLSEDPDITVHLLEAGPRDRHPYIHLPMGFAKMTAGPYTWGLTTAPQRHANQREIIYAQGRVLGGGSSINAEVYTRGVPEDYEAWEHVHGCEGWSWRDVLPFFLQAEDNDTLAGPLHRQGGPLGVCNAPSPQTISRAFVMACQQIGMPYNPDFNGTSQAGSGLYQTTTRAARRCSTAVGYLRPALGRKNLIVETGCLVTRLVLDGGRAVGVDYRAAGQARNVRAEREVLVTAGAIGSPKLLMLSGIGPADHLRSVGVGVAHDLPGVGANLHDHFGVDIVYELNGPFSLDKYNKLRWMAAAGLEYTLFRKGPVTSNVVEAGAFWYADRGASTPDLQFHFLAGAGVEAGVPAIASGSGVTLNSYTLRPRSRGSVTLRSADPADPAVVDPNFLADPEDLKISAEGVKISREIFRQPALARYIRKEHFPGESVRSQADYEAYARQYGRTSYHPVGACRMGQDGLAVVDPKLKVHGIEGLRVCDSSVMPRVTSSNTNAASIMIGERAAAFIRATRN